MAGWAAVVLVIAATLIGLIATVVLRQEPGGVLGVFVFLGTVIAGLGADYRASYLVAPLPALAYLVAACAAGYIHDKAAITGHLQLGLHAAEWIGNGFGWMLVATVAAVLVTGGRWLWARQDLIRHAGPRERPAGPRGPQPGPGRPGGGPPSPPAYSRPAAGYARSSNPRPSEPPPPPERPAIQGPRGTDQRQPDGGKDDPFRHYYDGGDTWR